MISIKNLTKVYTPKKGQPVYAINDISFELPEKGMVFLLGKSGSGKSTLLNLLGGLDSFTSGEIIIKGKSSKEFKVSDFDSYRNTYIGFVFQEFNILEEYSVGENISLALELQRKTHNRQTVEQVMESVDLEKTYFDRNINELSGGQKQRVSIARALVKKPKIIMADEPTGALDSATGKQIFDTLKKLSADKLVIVVSHDRESAETYGDRIIELADGKIIGDKVLCSENITGKEYSASDLNLIKSKLPLKNSIKMGISSLKLKRVRLAFSIFLSFIAFTIFGLGITGATFNQYKTEFETVKMNGEKTIMAKSQMGYYEIIDGKALYPYVGNGFTKEQISKIEQITGYEVLKLHVDDIDTYATYDFLGNLEHEPSSVYYATSLSNLLEVPIDASANLTAVASGSRLPTKGNYNEIAISDWVADSFLSFGLKNSSKTIESYDDLLGEMLVLEGGKDILEVEITGVYKTDVNKDKYSVYKDKSKITGVDIKILEARNNLVMSMGYVSPNFKVVKNEDFQTLIKLSNNNNNFWKLTTDENYSRSFSYADKISRLTDSPNAHFAEGRTLENLNTDEIIVSADFFNSMLKTDVEKINYFNALGETSKSVTIRYCNKLVGRFVIAGILLSDTGTIYLSDNGHESFENAINSSSFVYMNPNYAMVGDICDFGGRVNAAWKASEYDLSKINIYWGKGNSPKTKLSDNEVILNASSIIINGTYSEATAKSIFDNVAHDMLFGRIYSPENKIVGGKKVKVVGLNFDDSTYFGCPLVSDDIFEYAQELRSSPFSLIIKLSDDWSKNEELFNYLQASELGENGVYTRICPITSISTILDVANTWIPPIKNVFLYASIAFSIFAALLLMNIIAISVADKKKTIGILRAIGARSTDVLKIFLSEGLVIGLINFLLSYAAVIITSIVINKVLTISVLIPGILQALFMALLSFGVVTIATLIPSYKIAKKKPIDAINNK